MKSGQAGVTRPLLLLTSPVLYPVVLVWFMVSNVLVAASPRRRLVREVIARPDGCEVTAYGVLAPHPYRRSWRVIALRVSPPGQRSIEAVGTQSQLLRWADDEQIVLTCRAAADRVADQFELIGFVRHSPDSLHMTRRPRPSASAPESPSGEST